MARIVIAAIGALFALGPAAVGAQMEARIAGSEQGFSVAAMDALPKAPAGAGLSDFCKRYAANPISEASRTVRGQGWTVTGEAKLGTLLAVSFASKFEPATSGTCFIRDGNVALFDGGRLLAIAYAPKGSKSSIGRIEPLEGGNARIWDGDPPGQPVADLRLEDGRMRIEPVAPSETLCGGKAVVPNIYGMPIDRARKALGENGWRPVPGDPNAGDPRFGRERDLRKRGIVEVDGCSGTGFGYCSFTYKGASGGLSVTTMGDGDLPVVSGYDATCS
jgi:hypothetical protein